jgi:hypothetical protein
MKITLRKLLTLSLMVSSSFMPISDTSYNQIYSKYQTKIEQQISSLVDQRISEQERKFGWTYKKKPKIGLRFSNRNVLFSSNTSRALEGIYFPDRDSISFSFETFRPYNHFLKRIVDHELAHSYLFNRFGEIPGDSVSLFYPFVQNPVIKIRNEIIREGFAFYVETKINNIPDNFRDSEWPNSIDGFFVSERAYQRYQYEGGAHLLRPIIDKFGDRGLEYVINNLPEESDLNNLHRYQRRIIATLSIDKTCKHCI